MFIPARAVEPVRLAHEVRGSGPPLVLLAGTGYAGVAHGLFWQTPDPVIAEVVAFLEPPRPPRA